MKLDGTQKATIGVAVVLVLVLNLVIYAGLFALGAWIVKLIFF